ncbi:hypothetical protein HPB49_003904 [Dermacentor silvarum]|uniref:Uncharacterized protein n=1 Tax=Dermacentor silvarum TaxID=543639 RepID=A0ACB8C763_DERSI|nr:hypothetical protein HPB49_003904 [Dermacentor silvarum]
MSRPPNRSDLQQLLRDTDLCDHTPSQLLRYVQLLRGETTNTVDEAIFREVLLEKLPSSVRLVVAASEQNGLPAVAELADRLTAITTRTSLAAVRAEQAQDEVQQMREDISRLTETLSALRTSRKAQNLSEPNTSLSQTQRENIYWYHRWFGNAARNCVPPCARSGNDPGKH